MTSPCCEGCGAPATHFVGDLNEGEPTPPDSQNRRWATWELTATHRLCAAHARRPLVGYRPDRDPQSIGNIMMCETYAAALGCTLRGDK